MNQPSSGKILPMTLDSIDCDHRNNHSTADSNNMEDSFSIGAMPPDTVQSIGSSHDTSNGIEQAAGSSPLESFEPIRTSHRKKILKEDKQLIEDLPLNKGRHVPPSYDLQQSPGELTRPYRMQERSYSQDLFNAMLAQERFTNQVGEHESSEAGATRRRSFGSNISRDSHLSGKDDLVRQMMSPGSIRRHEYAHTGMETMSRSPPPRANYQPSGVPHKSSNAGGSVSRHSNGSQPRTNHSDHEFSAETFYSRHSPYSYTRSTPQEQQILQFTVGDSTRTRSVTPGHNENEDCDDDDISINSDITGLTGAFTSVFVDDEDYREDDHPDVPPLSYPQFDAAASKFEMLEAMNRIRAPFDAKQTATMRLSVRFGMVQVRSFERILGDNPSTTSGAPIGIGWKFTQYRPMPLNDYEKHRGPTRPSQLLLLSRDTRENMLLRLGYSNREISAAVRVIMTCRNKRRQTVQNLKAEGVEETVESAVKGVLRLFRFKKDAI